MLSSHVKSSLLTRVLVAATILVAAAAPLVASAHSPEVSAHISSLDTLSTGLESALRMEKASPGSSRDTIAGLQGRLPPRTPESIRDGLTRVGRASAKARAGQIAGLLEEVRTYRAAVERVPVNPPRSLAKARSALNDVLSSSDYKRSWTDNLSRWVTRLWLNLLSKISISESAAEVIGWVLLALVAVAFAVLLILLALKLIAHFSGKQMSPSHVSRTATTRKVRPSSESMIAQAELDAAAGRYRDAFRHVYLASLLHLDRASLITYSDSGTNWEYLRALRSRGATQKTEVFQGMTLLFDQLIYGKRSVAQEDYLTSVQRFRELEAAA